MLMGTAMTRASTEETSVPKMNGKAPYWSLTGSQSLVTRKCQPNFCRARCEPWNSSMPINAINTKTANAIDSVSHLNTRSHSFQHDASHTCCFLCSYKIIYALCINLNDD